MPQTHYMHYLNYLPGRERGLAYAAMNQNVRPRRTYIRISDNINNNLIERHGLSFSDEVFLNYEILREFKDVKINAISTKLFESSKIKMNQTLCFCAICQHDIFVLQFIRLLDCNHSYHIECIDKWFTESNKCPECRKEF